MGKKVKGKQYHLPYNIEAVRKILPNSTGRISSGEEDGNVGEDNKDFE